MCRKKYWENASWHRWLHQLKLSVKVLLLVHFYLADDNNNNNNNNNIIIIVVSCPFTCKLLRHIVVHAKYEWEYAIKNGSSRQSRVVSSWWLKCLYQCDIESCYEFIVLFIEIAIQFGEQECPPNALTVNPNVRLLFQRFHSIVFRMIHTSVSMPWKTNSSNYCHY